MSASNSEQDNKVPDKIKLFFDVSGSVCDNRLYWEIATTVFNNYHQDVSTIYIWGDELKKITKELFIETFLSKKFGNMPDTKPNDIATYLVSRKYGLAEGQTVVIVTDGRISQALVENTERLLGDLTFDNVECYIGVSGNANESIAIPFTRRGKKSLTKISDFSGDRTYESNEEIKALIYNLDAITLKTFEENFDVIERSLITALMGLSGNQKIADDLIRTKNRIAKELAIRDKDATIDELLMAALEQKDFDRSFSLLKSINDGYLKDDIGMELSKKFDYLINIASKGLKGQFDMYAIKSQRVQVAPQAVKVPVAEPPEESAIPKGLEDCPISFDKYTAQIIVNKGEPILRGLDKTIVDDVISQPLRLLNYPEIVQRIMRRISNWIGISSGIKTGDKNPFTRETISSVIPLGKCQQNVKCANWGLADLFFGDKLVGNPQMYFAAIWYLITNGILPWLSDISEQVGDTLIYRLKTTKTRASLCGLPQMVGTIIPTSCAVWFSVVSCLMEQLTDRDTLRFQVFNIEPLLAIIRLLDYPIVPSVLNQVNRTRVMLSMLQMVKKNSCEFRSNIVALSRNSYPVNFANIGEDVKKVEMVPPYVPLETLASPIQIQAILTRFPEYFKSLTIDELTWIANLVNPNKSAKDIVLPPKFTPPIVKCVPRWGYDVNDMTSEITQINPRTFRPFYNVKEEKWETYYRREYKIKGLIFSGNAKYLAFYQKYSRWANQDEFIVYCYNRYECSPLPEATVIWFNDINQSYELIRKIITKQKLTPADVIAKLKESCPIPERLSKEYKQS